MSAFSTPQALQEYREKLNTERGDELQIISLCGGTGCTACGSEGVAETFKEELKKHALDGRVRLRLTGCQGFCERAPLVHFSADDTLYQKVAQEDVADIVDKTVKEGECLDKFLLDDPETGEKYRTRNENPFFKNQTPTLLGGTWAVDPTSIDDYIAIGGYAALTKAFELGPEKIIEEVKLSHLRGRGGAGFPTGKKWETCRNVTSDKRYVICNANEGDPGEFMDRFLLEGNPHAVIEGMIIGAFAIGSDEGYIYIQKTYGLATRRLQIALDAARDHGLLGKNILGTGFSFDISINLGGGAFVCGESTALMASIEGKVGVPRAKHIHTVESGLNGKPSNLNNVETWANIPHIIEKGGAWFKSVGTEGSTGTKIVSLTGKVKNTGLVEVPMGTSLEDLINNLGGGVKDGRAFKAVQTGGPSGACLPKEKLNVPLDFDSLWEEGSMMGGGIIVMDDENCMVDIDKHNLGFLKSESCGKCSACREGLRRLHELVTDISEGRGTEETTRKIEKIAETVTSTALCALGTTATNSVISTLKYFKDEYEAHIVDKKCTAGVCKMTHS